MLNQFPFQSPFAALRNASKLKQTLRTGDAEKSQEAVNKLVREGCSVEHMQRLLKSAGLNAEETATYVAAAYPEAV
jgi:hypothetical protein